MERLSRLLVRSLPAMVWLEYLAERIVLEATAEVALGCLLLVEGLRKRLESPDSPPASRVVESIG